MMISLSDSTVQLFIISSLPSEIVAVYFPNGISNGTITGSSNFQFPTLSTSAVLVTKISPSSFLTVDVIALPTCCGSRYF